MKKTSLSIAVAAIAAFAGNTSAQVVNGEFTIDLSGWDTIGDVGFLNGSAFLTTASLAGDDGGPMLNYSGTDVVGSMDVEDFAGVSAFSLDPDPFGGIFAFEGSAIRQSFNVLAGQYFTFSWRLFSNNAAGNDYAFAVINGDIFTLGTQSLATSSGAFSYNGSTNVTTFQSSVFAVDSLATLTVGVLDVDDSITSTALQLDNVAVIPEPSSALLLGLAGFMTIFRRKR